MILIIGGAYQGKLDYARKRFGLRTPDICDCKDIKIDFSKKCIYSLEEFVWNCLKNESDPIACFLENIEKWQESILICQDIFCGVVPISEENRKWRQETGKLCQYLANEADEVIRVFCGLEQRIK